VNIPLVRVLDCFKHSIVCTMCKRGVEAVQKGVLINVLILKRAVQEKLYIGPVVKKEFHLSDVGSRNGSVCAKLSARCEWDASNARV
jgi:hypothetical protein